MGMRDSYAEQLNEKCLEAIQKLDVHKKDLGEDSFVYLRFLKCTLDTGKFLDHCEARAEEIADELRALGPRPPPSLEENHITEARAIGATALAHFLEILEDGGRTSLKRRGSTIKAKALKAEFGPELKRAQQAVELFRDPTEEEEGGWHLPPGFSNVDAMLKPPDPPPPPPPPKEIRLERKLPGMRDGEGLSMTLHGVDFEDVYRHNEILLLEMCADIIAEECKIPRDCIFNMSFSEPKKVTEDASAADETQLEGTELPEGATSKELVMEDTGA